MRPQGRFEKRRASEGGKVANFPVQIPCGVTSGYFGKFSRWAAPPAPAESPGRSSARLPLDPHFVKDLGTYPFCSQLAVRAVREGYRS